MVSSSTCKCASQGYHTHDCRLVCFPDAEVTNPRKSPTPGTHQPREVTNTNTSKQGRSVPTWYQLFCCLFYLTLFAMRPVKLAEGPGHCCVRCPFLRVLYPKLHDATITCNQFTEISHWPGKVLPLVPLTSLFIRSRIHATIIHHCLILPSTVLGTRDIGVQHTDTPRFHGHDI